MDATRAIQDSIHVFSLVRKYVSRILGTYQTTVFCLLPFCIYHSNKYYTLERYSPVRVSILTVSP